MRSWWPDAFAGPRVARGARGGGEAHAVRRQRQLPLAEGARFARPLCAAWLACWDGMLAPSRKKPKLPRELDEYWNRRLFERRDRDNN